MVLMVIYFWFLCAIFQVITLYFCPSSDVLAFLGAFGLLCIPCISYLIRFGSRFMS